MTPDGRPMAIDEEPGTPEPAQTSEPLTIRDHTRTAIEYGCAKDSTADLRARLRHAYATNEKLIDAIAQLRREVNALKLAASEGAK